MPESYSTTPPPSQGIRVGPLRDFLPHADDPLSTRGQKLPALIQNRSNASLNELLGQLQYRRRSSLRGSLGEYIQDRDGYGVEGGDRENVMSPGQKKLSLATALLNTPQMRSIRLIGNSNPRHSDPRYQWYVLLNDRSSMRVHCALR